MSVKYSFPANLHLSRECLDLISRIFVANPAQVRCCRFRRSCMCYCLRCVCCCTVLPHLCGQLTVLARPWLRPRYCLAVTL